ncbi:tetratricopeptide (TPR) repeat protein [Crossiella equi]|uniref:Tetratricopeptide (TPR) repeat protein n=1 Tax=Crossiella equi TaxID=130796 RepID=A0ABS5AH81_9PSEU|nr:hypothetical protein [Crossiella equi]MBP2475940.1 tetratricopeptide (TPR) repeat protein [Crossiella equi]
MVHVVTLAERATGSPRTVLRQAFQDLPTARGDDRARRRLAACLAHVELGEPIPAHRQARLALAGAVDPVLRAEIRLARAWLAVETGRPRAALSELDEATPLTGLARTKADFLRAAANYALREPLDLGRAVTELAPEPRWQANALIIRGADACHRGRPAEGSADFARAAELLTEIGLPDRAAVCLHNQGFAQLRMGNRRAALALFDRAAVDPHQHPEVLLDRAEALADAGAALAALRRAESLLTALGRERKLVEAKIRIAQHLLGSGDFAGAEQAAGEARRLLRAQRRPAWAVLAQVVELRARVRDGRELVGPGWDQSAAQVREWPEIPVQPVGPALPRALRPRELARVADRCAALGWPAEADELRLAAGRVASALGDPFAEELLARVRTPAVRWRAQAELASGPAAQRICRRGLRERRDPELLAIGLREALRGGEARAVAEWVRRGRGSSTPGLEYFLFQDWLWLAWSGRVWRLVPAAVLSQELAVLRLSGQGLDRIQELLLPEIPEGPVEVVPCREVTAVPWGALPGLAGREIRVRTPGWRPGVRRDAPPLWVAGPGLPGAEAEVRGLHAEFGGTLLVGATVGAVLRAVARAGTVHIAAHGRHYAGGVELADGVLALAEVFGRAGGVVVLAACGAGRGVWEGAGTVVAPVLDLPDAGVPFAGFHRGLARGRAPAALVGRGLGQWGFVCQEPSLARRSRASSRTSSRLQ